VSHPSWGAAVYPASLFARAPVQAIVDAAAHASATVPVIPRQEAPA
jgi:hypothetical protein